MEKDSDITKGRWRHFKGKEYKVLGIGRDCDTFKEFIVYQGQYDSPDFGKNPIFIRPKESFFEEVTRDGKTFPRFERLTENEGK